MKVMTVVVAPVSRVSVSEAKAFLAKVAAAMVQKMVDKAFVMEKERKGLQVDRGFLAAGDVRCLEAFRPLQQVELYGFAFIE